MSPKLRTVLGLLARDLDTVYSEYDEEEDDTYVADPFEDLDFNK
jgi:hypothetical protein